MNTICCFTGHRHLPLSQITDIQGAIRLCVFHLLKQGVTTFRTGGAIGFDTLATEILFKLRDTHPEMRVELFYPFEAFYAHWSREQIAHYHRLFSQFDRTICVCDTIHPPSEAYFKRNRRLVDGARYCVAYCNRKRSGTACTIRYAREQGCHIINLADGT